MFIVVRGKAERVAEINAYLYAGQTVATGVINGKYGSFCIVDTGTDDKYRSEYLLNRIQSGPYGAIMFNTMMEADAYIAGEKD
jgi:hypothetical protein